MNMDDLANIFAGLRAHPLYETAKSSPHVGCYIVPLDSSLSNMVAATIDKAKENAPLISLIGIGSSNKLFFSLYDGTENAEEIEKTMKELFETEGVDLSNSKLESVEKVESSISNEAENNACN